MNEVLYLLHSLAFNTGYATGYAQWRSSEIPSAVAHARPPAEPCRPAFEFGDLAKMSVQLY